MGSNTEKNLQSWCKIWSKDQFRATILLCTAITIFWKQYRKDSTKIKVNRFRATTFAMGLIIERNYEGKIKRK